MGLIGNVYELGQGHPQELIDDVYREVFDHHPADQEIDLLITFRDLDFDISKVEAGTGDINMHRVEVLDFAVARIHDEYLMTEDETDSRAISNMRGIVEWGWDRWTDAPDTTFYVMHKHKEDFARPGQKDFQTVEILNALDLIKGYEKPPRELDGETYRDRMFGNFVVVNRADSYVMRMPAPAPVGIADIDWDVAAIMLELGVEAMRKEPELLAQFEDELPRVPEIADHLRMLAQLYRSATTESEREPLIEEVQGPWGEGMELGKRFAKAYEAAHPEFSLAEFGGPPADLLEQLQGTLREMLEKLGVDVDVELDHMRRAEGQVAEPFESLPFDVPTIDFDGPRVQPPSIFDLPAIDKLDDDEPKVNWEN